MVVFNSTSTVTSPIFYGFGDYGPAHLGTNKKISEIAREIFVCLTECLVFSLIAFGGFYIWTHPYLIQPIAYGKIIGYGVTLISSVAAFILLGKTAHTFLNYKYQIHQTQTFPYEIIKKNSENSPSVGKFLEADILVSQSVDETFEWKKELMRSAKNSIECSFNFAGGKPFREILKIISAKMVENKELKIHFLLSPECLQSKDIIKLKHLKTSYPERFFHMISGPQFMMNGSIHTEENHVKLLIIDESYFVLGGTGVVPWMIRQHHNPANRGKRTLMERFFPSQWRDTDVIGKASSPDQNIVATMRSQFFNLYQILAWRCRQTLSKNEGIWFELQEKCLIEKFDLTPSLKKNVQTKLLVSSPGDPFNPIEDAYCELIQNAQKIVRISNLIYHPTEKIRKSMRACQAKKIGYLDGPKNNPLINITVSCLTKLSKDFDEIHIHADPQRTYHSKMATADSKNAIVGTANMGIKSMRYDYETVLVFESPEVTSELERIQKEDEKMATSTRPSLPYFHRAFRVIGSDILKNFL